MTTTVTKALRLFAALPVLAALSSPGRADEVDTLKVQFGTIALPAFAAPFVARENGAYRRERLDVELQVGRLSQDTVNTIAAGTADIGFILAINQILSADKGQPLISVGNMYGRNAFGVVAAKGTGINSLADLPGHSVLVPGGSYESLLRAVLGGQGIDAERVKYILVSQPAAMLTMYIGKQADAITTVIPFASTAVEGSRPSVYIPYSDVGDPEPLYVWVVRPDVLAKKRDQIRRFLKVTYETVDALNRDPSLAVEPFVKSVPGANADRVASDYRAWMPFQCAPGQTVVGRPDLPSLKTALALYKKVGLIHSIPAADTLATDAFFEPGTSVSSVKCPG